MKTVVIIQARLNSTRLPGKVLYEVASRSMIALMIERVRRCRLVDEIVVATGEGRENDALEHVVRDCGMPVFRGSEKDVLKRYVDAAKQFGADVIVRLTGDCPLADPELIDAVISCRNDRDLGYATNVKPPTWPDGLDVSVIKREVLVAAGVEATLPSDREHVVPWIWRQTPLDGGNRFSAMNIRAPHDLSAYRWTVDEAEDYLFLKRLARELGDNGLIDSSWQDILQVIHDRPDLFRINSAIARDEGYQKSLQEDKEKSV